MILFFMHKHTDTNTDTHSHSQTLRQANALHQSGSHAGVRTLTIRAKQGLCVPKHHASLLRGCGDYDSNYCVTIIVTICMTR